jgi:NNP family nitrate/nitrite transporter-like MFS transporter
MFMILFVCAGIGNGSTYRMIPLIFLTLHQRKAKAHDTAHLEITQKANKEAGVAIGLTSAVAAYGAFFIPKSYGTSISMTGSPQAALIGFAIFYVCCVLMTWWFYFRKNAEVQC